MSYRKFLAPGVHKKRNMLKEKDIKCIIKVGLLPNGYPLPTIHHISTLSPVRYRNPRRRFLNGDKDDEHS